MDSISPPAGIYLVTKVLSHKNKGVIRSESLKMKIFERFLWFLSFYISLIRSYVHLKIEIKTKERLTCSLLFFVSGPVSGWFRLFNLFRKLTIFFAVNSNWESRENLIDKKKIWEKLFSWYEFFFKAIGFCFFLLFQFSSTSRSFSRCWISCGWEWNRNNMKFLLNPLLVDFSLSILNGFPHLSLRFLDFSPPSPLSFPHLNCRGQTWSISSPGTPGNTLKPCCFQIFLWLCDLSVSWAEKQKMSENEQNGFWLKCQFQCFQNENFIFKIHMEIPCVRGKIQSVVGRVWWSWKPMKLMILLPENIQIRGSL